MEEPLWRKGTFLAAQVGGATEQAGFLYRGMAMWKLFNASPKGRRPPWWSLTHCGTGHRVCVIKAHMVEAFDIATEIAECGEWDFDSLNGWRDRDPELMDKVRAVLARHGDKCARGTGQEGNEDVAREVAMARA
jgi:hypothetical protein